jgi:hypothetical protein
MFTRAVAPMPPRKESCTTPHFEPARSRPSRSCWPSSPSRCWRPLREPLPARSRRAATTAGPYYACLRFDCVGYPWWNGAAVLHVNLPDQYAREVLACGADLRASIWGADGSDSEDDFIRNMVLAPGPPQVDYAGISANFNAPNLNSSQLDEDDGTDELYARMSYWDCHTGLTRNFRSSNYVANFGWG